MNLKKVGIILFLIFSLFPTQNIFAQTKNTGFVSGNIWYSKDPLEEGDKVKIYTFVFNPDARELSGSVIFFDKTTLLGKKDFVIPAKGADDVSIDWTVSTGDHSIFAKIENAKFLISKGNYEEVYLAENETEKSTSSISKKIITSALSQIKDNKDSIISDIQKIIEDKTPNIITKPITSTTNTLEKLRLNTNIASENKQKELKIEIKALDDTKGKINAKTVVSPMLRPFKYVELFLLSIASFILNNKILFYGLILIFVFFILRFIWKKIF